MARLAARGAGLSWGLAEDAGLAAGWLAARGLPFAAAFASRARGDFCAPDENKILRGELTPSVAGEMLCPFAAGTLIGDLSRVRLRWRISRAARPLILAPFVAIAAAAANRCMKIQWGGAVLITDGENAAVVRNENIAAALADARISPCSPPRDFAAIAAPVSEQCAVAAREWKKLNALAARTFVAATAESRLRGAGAAAKDGD